MKRPVPSSAATGLTARSLLEQLRRQGDPRDAAFLQRYFKTGPGEYGHGDVFLGVRVPVLRRLARAARELPLAQVERLLDSPYHEARLLGLLVMVENSRRAAEAWRRQAFRLYLARHDRINNWDLVDLAAPHLIGAWLEARERAMLDRLARSADVWRRRTAIVATAWFIRRGEYADTLRLAAGLLEDPHDLIHKATGWMLREVGKRDQQVLEGFLARHAHRMPRTMLRYAIERLPERRRRAWLKQRQAVGGPGGSRDGPGG